MFPGMIHPVIAGIDLQSEMPDQVGHDVQSYIDKWEGKVMAYKMPGAGGGGYLACVVEDARAFSDTYPEAIRLTIRRGGM